MDLTLISNGFSNSSGYGIQRYSYDLYSALSATFNITKVDLSAIANYLNIPILGPPINRRIYFSMHIDKIKNKNVHFLQPLLTTKYLKSSKKKIVTFWDFYVFDKNYIKMIYPKEASMFKKLIVSNIRRLSLADTLKVSKAVNVYDYIFTVNEKVASRLTNDFGIEPDKIGVSYPIVNSKFVPIKRYKKEKTKIIGYVNSYPYNKREKLRVFIETFKKLKNENLALHLYGNGFPFNELIKDDNRIKYFGFAREEDIVKIYNSFDVYLSTSTTEGFGIPIIQAKACETPVLCYDGDLPTVIKRNTIIWNEENIEQILKDQSWEKLDLKKATLDAEECKSNTVIPKIIEVYKNVYR